MRERLAIIAVADHSICVTRPSDTAADSAATAAKLDSLFP